MFRSISIQALYFNFISIAILCVSYIVNIMSCLFGTKVFFFQWIGILFLFFSLLASPCVYNLVKKASLIADKMRKKNNIQS